MTDPAAPSMRALRAMRALCAMRRTPSASLAPAWLLALAVLAGGAPGCSLLWLFQSNPEGLPCELDESGVGSCLDGYACVARGEDELPVCLKSAALRQDEECEATEQCQDGLVCASAFAFCTGVHDDPNCSLIDDDEKVLRCRPVCTPGDHSRCGDNGRCFQGALGGFCQRGVCAADSDCQAGGDNRFCVDERITGNSGLCFETCDPLRCSGDSCADCTGLDGVPDLGQVCVPVIDEFTLSTRTMCDAAGTLPPLAACDRFGVDRCGPQSFCNDYIQGIEPYCAQWCRFPTGAPACDGNARCDSPFGGDLGICVPR